MYTTRSGRDFRISLLAAVLCLCLLRISAAAELESCLTCHGGIAKGSVVHGPVADSDCTACHKKPDRGGHPGSTGGMVLTEKGEKLCAPCHESKQSAKYVHAPVAEGCTACHDPHSAQVRYLLKKSGSALCFECHDDISHQAFPHAPVSAGECLACHDPHQSDNRFLLKKPADDLCRACHRMDAFNQKYLHAPLKKDGCLSCHRPHGSAFRKLLKANYAAGLSLPYDSGNFALCFECHNKEMMTDYRTELSTNFRNGYKNLHIVHVISPIRGRSCKTCHDPHAAHQEMLINERVPGFGKWQIPIAYRKTATGGTCVVGCHKPRSYDRTVEENYR